MLKRIIRRIQLLYYLSSSDRFCKYLKINGIKVGGGNSFRPKTTSIDFTRPSLITIGDNCYFNENFTILTHDYVTKVFINSGREFINSSGRVTIGNNVSTGQNVMILKGVTIGDNVFIGANSVVTKDIPSNSIAVGSPCKVIMSLEDYYQKRRVDSIFEALDYARSIYERFNRKPVITDFWEEFPLFIDKDNISEYPELLPIVMRQCGPSYDNFISTHKAKFSSFAEFLRSAGVE